MGKKQNIIHINGKRYDAHTGAPLDHEHAATSPAVVKPIAVKHEASTAVHKPVHKPVHHDKTARHAAKPAAHHKQQRSTTLMRQSVKKPSASLKSRIKVQSHTGALAEQPAAEIVPKFSFNSANPKRLAQASRVKRSQLIMHFNPRQPDYSTQRITVTVKQPEPTATTTPKAVPVPRQAAPDIDDIFERAIQQASSHLEPAPKKSRKHRLHLGRRHARA